MRSLKEIESIGKREAAELARIKAVGLRTSAALKRHPDSAGLQRQRARLAAQWTAQNKRVEELRAQYDAARKASAPATPTQSTASATKAVSESEAELAEEYIDGGMEELSQRDKQMIVRGYSIAVTQVMDCAEQHPRSKLVGRLADEMDRYGKKYAAKLAKSR